jgi:hypothetical protein
MPDWGGDHLRLEAEPDRQAERAGRPARGDAPGETRPRFALSWPKLAAWVGLLLLSLALWAAILKLAAALIAW